MFINVYIFFGLAVLYTWPARHQAVFASKEVLSDSEDTALLTKRLWLAIEKRLKNYRDKADGLSTFNEKFIVKNATIIKTEESLNEGAVFLNFSLADNQHQCEASCINIPDCNMAVFKDSGKHACYLFNCGNPSICLFSTHPHYQSMALPHRAVEPLTAKHEQDLADLLVTSTTTTSSVSPSKKTTHTTATTTTTTTTAPPTTTSTTTTTTTTPAKPITRTADLFGLCDAHTLCSGVNQICLSSYCVCKSGFQAQEGVCKLPPKETEKHADKPNGDLNSDEENGKTGSSTTTTRADISHSAPSVNKTHMNSPLAPTNTKTDGANDKNKDGSNSNEVQDDLQSTGKPPVDTSKVDKSSKDDKSVTGSDDGKPDVIAVDLKENIETEVSEVVVAPASNRGAIVALALGLSVTALLLVFVGCRLRTVKRRLRRGRPLTSNEADYLINGMYL